MKLKLVQDPKQYAKLLLSVGTQGRKSNKNRPLSPIECAEMIKKLKDEEELTASEIAERLDLGRPESGSSIYKERDNTQVGVFLNLLDLSKKIRHFAGWGWEGFPKVPFSTIVLLASLSPNDQDKIIQSMYGGDKKRVLTKDDVRKIREWRNNNSRAPISKGIAKVLKMKPVVETNYIVVCEIHGELSKFIKKNSDYQKKILKMLKKSIKGNFYEVSATDILISISMDQNAYNVFHKQQYKQGKSFTDFLNNLLERKIGRTNN